jgi:hypothetical protein
MGSLVRVWRGMTPDSTTPAGERKSKPIRDARITLPAPTEGYGDSGKGAEPLG